MVGFTVTLALMMGLVSLPIWISTSRDWLKHFKKKIFLQRWEEEMYCMLSTRWRRWLFHQVVQQGHMVGGTFLGSHLFHCEWVASPCVNNLHWFTISSLPSWTTLEHISLCVHGEDCIVIVNHGLVCAWRRLHCYSQSLPCIRMEKTALLQSVVTLYTHGEDCIVTVSHYLVYAWRRLRCYSQSFPCACMEKTALL